MQLFLPDGAITETVLRLGAFIAVFVVMAAGEAFMPRRTLSYPKGRRWFTNLAIVAFDSVVVRLMATLSVPLVAVAAAIYAGSQGWGLFNWLELPYWIEVALTLVILDLAIWFQHIASHKVPLFWRLHQMHHADVDFDVTTAIRFHPIEIALSMLWKIVCVLALGAAPEAVILFEIVLNGCAVFNHANVALPARADRILRLILVTPDMHRVHHSVLNHEHNSNYGFNLSVWDRLFRTYTPQPENGHEGMTIGLAPYQNANPTRFSWSLLLPFRKLRRSL
ncbi:MAG: sterol desaturase family protein [Hyphomicrobiaceae bacterium]